MNAISIEQLKSKGFSKKHYEDQGLVFYEVTYREPKTVAEFFERFYELTDDYELDLNKVSFTVAIQDDLVSHPQWTFEGDLEKFHLFESVEEFAEFFETLPKTTTQS